MEPKDGKPLKNLRSIPPDVLRFVFTTDGDRGGWAWDSDPKRRYGFLAVPGMGGGDGCFLVVFGGEKLQQLLWKSRSSLIEYKCLWPD